MHRNEDRGFHWRCWSWGTRAAFPPSSSPWSACSKHPPELVPCGKGTCASGGHVSYSVQVAPPTLAAPQEASVPPGDPCPGSTDLVAELKLQPAYCPQEQQDAGPSAGTAWGEGKPGWFSIHGSKARVSELGHKLCQCLVSAHVYLLLGSTQHTEFPHLTVLSFLSPGNTTQRQHLLQCDCHPADRFELNRCW